MTDQHTTRKPRLLVVSDAIAPWHHGGKEARYAQILDRVKDRMDVTVATMHWWDGPERTIERDGVTYRSITKRRSMYTKGRRSIPQAIFFALATLRLIFTSFDVLEADHMPYLQLFPLRLVTWVRRRPFTVTWHELWGKQYWRNYLGAPGVVAAWIEGLALRLPDVVLAVTPELVEQLRAEGRTKVTVYAPNAPAALCAAPMDNDIFYVGRLIEHKRVDALLAGLAELRVEDPAASLTVVGVGPQDDELRAMAYELGIEGAVHFLGAVDDETVDGLMGGARVLALLSEREGFGISVAQALAAGTPVVTSNHSDNAARHLPTDELGACVDANDPAAVAAALAAWRKPSTSRAERADLFKKARPEFDWDRVTDACLEVWGLTP
jgi:glycosyltransferase involved in cell wall biosynthesis